MNKKNVFHFIALMVTIALFAVVQKAVSNQLGESVGFLLTYPFGFCTALFIDGLFRNQ